MDTLPFVKATRELDQLAKAGDFAAALSGLEALEGKDLSEAQRNILSSKRKLLERQSERASGDASLRAPACPAAAAPAASQANPAVTAKPAVETEPKPTAPGPTPPEPEPTPPEPEPAPPQPEPAAVEPVSQTVAPVVTVATLEPPAEPPKVAEPADDTQDEMPDELALPPEIESQAAALSARMAEAKAQQPESEPKAPVVAEQEAPAVSAESTTAAVAEPKDQPEPEADSSDSADQPEPESEASDSETKPDQDGSELDLDEEVERETEQAPVAVSKSEPERSEVTADALLALASARIRSESRHSKDPDAYVAEKYRAFRAKLAMRAFVLLIATVVLVFGAFWLFQALAWKPPVVSLVSAAPIDGVSIGGSFSQAQTALTGMLGSEPEVQGDRVIWRANGISISRDTSGQKLGRVSIQPPANQAGRSEWMINTGAGASLSSVSTYERFKERLTSPAWQTFEGDKSVTFTHTGSDFVTTLMFYDLGSEGNKQFRLGEISIRLPAE